MADVAMIGKSERLVSLDVFRGITIAGMVLVNNPGSWGHLWKPLGHAKWHGWTPTDFIFPFFLFIVGVAMVFSFDKRLAQGHSRLRLFEQVARRTVILFFLGLILTTFPNLRMMGPYILVIAGLGYLFADEPPFSFPAERAGRVRKIAGYVLMAAGLLWLVLDLGTQNTRAVSLGKFQWFMLFNGKPVEGGGLMRIPGVLQRIALAYFFGSLIMMGTRSWKGRLAWVVVLLVGYWLVMKFVPAPGGHIPGTNVGNWEGKNALSYRGELNDWIDIKVFGGHLLNGRPDPEGLLSTIPSIGTVLMGVLTGMWMRATSVPAWKRALGLLAGGLVCLGLGWLWSLEFPINKKIWTSSFVIFMAGWAALFLAACYWLIDVFGWKRWSWPFVVFGTNAIYVFFASGILARTMSIWRDSTGMNMKEGIYTTWFLPHFGKMNEAGAWVSTELSSHMFALFYIVLWLLLTYPLYRKKIFLKI